MSSRSRDSRTFWGSALAWTESVTPKVIGRVVAFTMLSVVVTFICKQVPRMHLSVGLLEVSGAVIGLILIIRINAGYDRWWEARKLWGGIVNQSRNLALAGVSYGPAEAEWRREFLKHVTEFPALVVNVLRDNLEKNVAYLSSAKVGKLIASAYKSGQIKDPVFWSLEKQRAILIDHLGACERILKSPLPLVLDIKVRRFLMIYLALVPIGLVAKIGWYTPVLMFFVSYSVLAVDQIGVELQNPFSKDNLSSLPIDDISKNIEKQIMFMAADAEFSEARSSVVGAHPAIEFQFSSLRDQEESL